MIRIASTLSDRPAPKGPSLWDDVKDGVSTFVDGISLGWSLVDVSEWMHPGGGGIVPSQSILDRAHETTAVVAPMAIPFVIRGAGVAGGIFARVQKLRAMSVVTNRHGQLTNGRYILDHAGMLPHTTGSLAAERSQFLYSIDEKRLTLDAAAYADEAGLWIGNKGKVVFDDYIGVHGGTGERTKVLNLYRTDTGFVHSAPGSPL